MGPLSDRADFGDGGFLLVLAGARPGSIFPLRPGEYVIGRARDADIRLDQASVSQRHARLILVNGEHRVVDLKSTNGTFVNGERVTADGLLRAGDVLRVGETVMSFLSQPEDPGRPSTIAISHVPIDAITHQGVRSLAKFPGQNRDLQFRAGDEGLTLHDVVGGIIRGGRFLRPYHPLIAGCVFAASFAGAASVRVKPPQGRAAFEIRLTPKPSDNPGTQSDDRFFSAAEMDFRSPELIGRTLTALSPRPPTREEVVSARNRLQFDGIALGTYRATFTDRSTRDATRFLEQQSKEFVAFEVEKTLHVMSAEVTFLRGQLDTNDAELTKMESSLRDFKERHPDGLPDQAKEEFTARLSLKARQTDLAAEVERSTLALAAERNKITADDPLFSHKVEAAAPYETALVDVKQKLGQARASGLGDEHPEVQHLERQEQELERLSRQTVQGAITDTERRADPALRALNDRIADLRVSKNAASRELARVSGDLAELDRAARELPDVEAQYAELTRTYAGTKELHAKLFARYKASELDLDLEKALAAARYQITSPTEPTTPPLRRTVFLRSGIGSVLGLLLATLLIAFVELRRYVRENEF